MMNITVKQNLSDYTIRQMERIMTGNGDYELSWKFNRATHFLIIIHQIRVSCDLKEHIVPWLSENGEQLLENRKIIEDDILWNTVTEREFINKRNKLILPRKDFVTGIPYRIVVYPCRIEEKNWEIYEVLNGSNIKTIPVSVWMEIVYEKSLRSLFFKEKLCKFRLRLDINRLDVNQLQGVLWYKLSCSQCLFPISVESMRMAKDGWLFVWLPKSEELKMIVSPEYKDYYNIKIADD